MRVAWTWLAVVVVRLDESSDGCRSAAGAFGPRRPTAVLHRDMLCRPSSIPACGPTGHARAPGKRSGSWLVI